jgi:hypothetical protein
MTQTIFVGNKGDSVRFQQYWPCIVRDISPGKDRLEIEFVVGKHTYVWEVPATVVDRNPFAGSKNA